MKVIFFDMDDTIYDRGVPFERAFAAFFGHKDNNLARKAYRTCSVRSNEVFEDSQMGRISMEEMYIYRYQKGFADVGIALTDEEALRYQKTYALMQSRLEMTAEMEAVMELCSRHFDKLGILTNGPGDHQRAKAAALGMERWLTEGLLIVSGDYKIIKPDPRIFRIAQTAAGCQAEDILYVGDSLENDIAPAAALGWRTVWLNRRGLPLPEELNNTAVVERETELLQLLRSECC